MITDSLNVQSLQNETSSIHLDRDLGGEEHLRTKFVYGNNYLKFHTYITADGKGIIDRPDRVEKITVKVFTSTGEHALTFIHTVADGNLISYNACQNPDKLELMYGFIVEDTRIDVHLRKFELPIELQPITPPEFSNQLDELVLKTRTSIQQISATFLKEIGILDKRATTSDLNPLKVLEALEKAQEALTIPFPVEQLNG